MKSLLLTALFAMLFTMGVYAQKAYFDKTGKATDASSAYYIREKGADNAYKAYYASGNQLYFEGKLINADTDDEIFNKYTGPCTWYFKNGKKKSERDFDADGLENGTSKYYYESGNLWKEIIFNKGKRAENFIIEFSEDGEKTKLFGDEFDENSNDWDLYDSDKSTADIAEGKLVLTCSSDDGTSRHINIPTNSSEYAIEANVDITGLKPGGKVGILYGFKDWENYRYFVISSTEVFVGGMYEGILNEKTSGAFSSAITTEKPNKLKIITSGEKVYFSVNGEIQLTSSLYKMIGKNVGFILSGKGSTVKCDDFLYKELGFEGSSSSAAKGDDTNVKSTGSGAIVSTNGYIITNHHVIDDADKILVEMPGLEGSPTYTAKLIQQDEDNDIAIIRIDDPNFKPLTSINYSFKQTAGAMDVGTSVFTIGYPLALNGMGKEPKFTDGRVSAKTGYNNAINSFQTSIPVQPGNSGGPLFNLQGQLVGLINATVNNTDNVSYAIKLSYINNLLELVENAPMIPADNSISKLALEEQIKVLAKYVVLVKIK